MSPVNRTGARPSPSTATRTSGSRGPTTQYNLPAVSHWYRAPSLDAPPGRSPRTCFATASLSADSSRLAGPAGCGAAGASPIELAPGSAGDPVDAQAPNIGASNTIGRTAHLMSGERYWRSAADARRSRATTRPSDVTRRARHQFRLGTSSAPGLAQPQPSAGLHPTQSRVLARDGHSQATVGERCTIGP